MFSGCKRPLAAIGGFRSFFSVSVKQFSTNSCSQLRVDQEQSLLRRSIGKITRAHAKVASRMDSREAISPVLACFARFAIPQKNKRILVVYKLYELSFDIGVKVSVIIRE